MADEVQDCSVIEQDSICLRYVIDVGEVCEDFMGFVALDAQCIADTLLPTLQQLGLDMTCLVAQGYDGSSV